MFLLLVEDGDGLDVEDEAEDPVLLSEQYLESLTDLCLLMLTTSLEIQSKDNKIIKGRVMLRFSRRTSWKIQLTNTSFTKIIPLTIPYRNCKETSSKGCR